MDILNAFMQFEYELVVNVDGLPIFNKSPDFKLYPILVIIKGIETRPICAGIYCSVKARNREMPHSSILLQQFLEDIEILKQNTEFRLIKMFLAVMPLLAVH